MNTSAQGLRVLVTAGAAGIGRAFASTFHEAGAKVFVCDVDADALSELRAEHPQIGTAVTDVAAPSQVEELFDTAASFLDGLDVLINKPASPGRPQGSKTSASWNGIGRSPSTSTACSIARAARFRY